MHGFIKNWVLAPKTLVAVTNVRDRLRGNRSGDEPFDGVGERLSPEGAAVATLHELRTARPRDVLWVPLEQVRTVQATGFTREQSQYVRYLFDGEADFRHFYELHRPHDHIEAIFLDPSSLSGPYVPQPPAPLEGPWDSLDNQRASSLADTPWFGPVSESRVQREISRLSATTASIKQSGLWLRDSGDNIRYELFIDDVTESTPDFRAVIRGGNHRVAALSFLGWELIPMGPMPTYLREIRLSDLEHWPRVLDGNYSPEAATDYFRAFFRDDQHSLLPGW